MMTEREARKPWRKLSSDIKDPFSANSSAGDRDLSSATCPSPLRGSAGSLSAKTKEKNENMEKKKTTVKLTLFILITLFITSCRSESSKY